MKSYASREIPMLIILVEGIMFISSKGIWLVRQSSHSAIKILHEDTFGFAMHCGNATSQICRLSEFKSMFNFYFSWNHQKTYGFPMVSGGIEVN